MLRISLMTTALLWMAGCSINTHNTSKGTCHDIQVCTGGQCTSKTDKMTQENCTMVGGRFEPNDHKGGWLAY